MGEHLARVVKRFDDAVENFNKTVGAMESRVMVQACRFRDLQVAGHTEMEPLAPVECTTPAQRRRVDQFAQLRFTD